MVRQSLIGGRSTSEGLVEVCVDDTYLPVSLDDGRFSVAEATVICRELGIGNGQLNQQYSLLPQILNRAVCINNISYFLFVGVHVHVCHFP